MPFNYGSFLFFIYSNMKKITCDKELNRFIEDAMWQIEDLTEWLMNKNNSPAVLHAIQKEIDYYRDIISETLLCVTKH